MSTGHYKRRRRIEFLDFMNQLVRQYPADQEIHVILDNLSTHAKKGGTWLARHPNVHFHFTPTNASWLNQIEVWFSILTVRVLRGGSFTSPRDLRERHRPLHQRLVRGLQPVRLDEGGGPAGDPQATLL